MPCKVCAPSQHSFIATGPSGSVDATTIDMFLVSNDIQGMAGPIMIPRADEVAGHNPIQLEISRAIAQVPVRVLVTATQNPDPAVGPQPDPGPIWDGFHVQLQEGTWGSTAGLWKDWNERAERESHALRQCIVRG